MKRVLIFSTTYLPFVGGAEVAVCEITRRMPDTHFDIVTVNLDGKQFAVEEKENRTIYRVGKGTWAKLTFPFTALKLGIDMHKKDPYDCVWSIMASYAGVAGMWFKKKYPDVPFVLTLQEGDSAEGLRRKFRFVWPLFVGIFRRADHVQAISEYLANVARGVDPDARVTVIPNGVDVDRFAFREENRKKFRCTYGYAEDTKVIVSTSRLTHKNGIDTLIQALPLLPSDVCLHLVGDGEDKKTLQQLACDLGVLDRVTFAGSMMPEDIPMQLHAGDIFARPSRSEGFGNSFVEAMAAGLPVVATPVGGIVDFINNKETGLFCEPDNPESVAEAVQQILEDDELRRKIIQHGQQVVQERYDWDVIAEEMKNSVFGVLY